MYASDFADAQSTHQLLYCLFASEIGLMPVTAPGVQALVLSNAFSGLQTLLATKVKESASFELAFDLADGHSLGTVEVSYRDDARIFMALYGPFKNYDDENRLLSWHVYPLVGTALNAQPAILKLVSKQLEHHVRKYGAPVGSRILLQLPAFKLDSLIPELTRVVAELQPRCTHQHARKASS